MPPNTPLAVVIVEMLRHTPAYAWAILAVLILLGALQLRDHQVPRARLALAPLGMGLFSLWGATMAFGVRPNVVAAWALGIGLALLANRGLRWPREARATADGGYALRGSPWPLALMLGIFALRYAVAVSLAFHHDLIDDAAFSLGMALLYGALSGLFTARALRILRTSRAPAGWAPA